MGQNYPIFENKLVGILHCLNRLEINQFTKYINSSFFNENELVKQLLEIYLPSIKNKEEITETKESIWQQIFPNKKYNDTKFRRINSDLLKLLEGYLSYKEYSENEVISSLSLLKSVQKRGINKLVKSSLKQASQALKKHPFRNGEFYHNEYLLELEYAQTANAQFQRNEQINLDKIADNLDYFFISEKLKYYCELINSKGVFEIEYEMLFSTEILNHLKKHPYEDIPVISIYHKIYLSLKEPDVQSHYGELCQLLQEHSHKFPIDEARLMYGFAQNYCIKKINSGKAEFLEELFKLYQVVIEKKIIFVNNTLSPWDYKNIVTVGIRIKRFVWIEKFIHQYKNILPDEFRDTAYSYNLSKVYFSKNEFGKVIKLLQSIDYQDIFYLLDSKATLLKSFYELKEFETLSRLLDSFKILLNRKKNISKNYRINYLNLIKHAQKLVDIQNGKTKKLAILKEDIADDTNVADLGWLKEKIAEFEE